MGDLQNRQAALKAACEKLSSDKRVIVGKLDDALPKTGIAREDLCDSGLQFIRRTHDAGHHYFIANLTAKPIEKMTVPNPGRPWPTM
jgi:hypothetical protein